MSGLPKAVEDLSGSVSKLDERVRSIESQLHPKSGLPGLVETLDLAVEALRVRVGAIESKPDQVTRSVNALKKAVEDLVPRVEALELRGESSGSVSAPTGSTDDNGSEPQDPEE
jgi:chaperonin cofactor prefoldin